MSQPYPNQPGGPPPAPYYQQPAAEDPGKTLGIIGLVGAFLLPLVGLIISIIGFNKSKKAGFRNIPALVGIIIGAIGTVTYVIIIGVSIAALSAIGQQCAELGPGVHENGGVTITCPG